MSTSVKVSAAARIKLRNILDNFEIFIINGDFLTKSSPNPSYITETLTWNRSLVDPDPKSK